MRGGRGVRKPPMTNCIKVGLALSLLALVGEPARAEEKP
jgi:hypothetical protein